MAEASAGVAEEEAFRADLYDLLGMLLARPPSAELLGRVAALGGSRNASDAGPLDQPVSALGRLARRTTPQAVRTEYDALFIGLVRASCFPIPPTT